MSSFIPLTEQSSRFESGKTRVVFGGKTAVDIIRTLLHDGDVLLGGNHLDIDKLV